MEEVSSLEELVQLLPDLRDGHENLSTFAEEGSLDTGDHKLSSDEPRLLSTGCYDSNKEDGDKYAFSSTTNEPVAMQNLHPDDIEGVLDKIPSNNNGKISKAELSPLSRTTPLLENEPSCWEEYANDNTSSQPSFQPTDLYHNLNQDVDQDAPVSESSECYPNILLASSSDKKCDFAESFTASSTPVIEKVQDSVLNGLQEVKMGHACVISPEMKVLRKIYLKPKKEKSYKKQKGVTRLKNRVDAHVCIFSERERRPLTYGEMIKTLDGSDSEREKSGLAISAPKKKKWGDNILQEDALDDRGKPIPRVKTQKFVNQLLEKVEVSDGQQRSRVHVNARTEFLPLIMSKVGSNPKYYRKETNEVPQHAANKQQNMTKLQTNLFNRTMFGWMTAALFYFETKNELMLSHVMDKIREAIQTIPYVANRVAQTLGAGQKYDLSTGTWTKARACLGKLVQAQPCIIPEDPMQVDLGGEELKRMRSFFFDKEIFICK